MTDIKRATAKLLEDEFKVDPQTTNILFDNGILDFKECRDLLIKNEYVKKVEPKEKIRLRDKLAIKYCISVSLVEKILSKNT
jgi:hypothetical protein